MEGFSLIVVFAPDDWAIALVREQIPTILPDAGAMQRICFDPRADPDSLADSLMELPEPSTVLRLLWIDADPGPPDEFEKREASWRAALAKLNRYRNTLQARLSCTLAIALPSRLQQTLREAAPDIWSIRSGVFRIEPPGGSRAAIEQLPLEERLSWERVVQSDSGDPAETLAEADKLRGKPGREILLARLLQRAGDQYRTRLAWSAAQRCLEEAYTLVDRVGGDPEIRWDVAVDLANVFDDMARYDRAEHYLRRALDIAEHHFGQNDARTALTLNNLALLLKATNRLAEAEPLMRRALAIFETALGTDHPKTQTAAENLRLLREEMANA